MATLEELGAALQKAHEAGDKQGAMTLARAYQTMKDGTPRDVTQDMSGMEKFNAGVGKAFVDMGRGIGNIVTDIAPGAAKYGFATRADTEQAQKLDANLMNTGAGMAGNIGGNITMMAPAMMIPGAASLGGAATIGALGGMLQPVGKEDSRLANQGIGAAAGAIVPLAVNGTKAAKAALVDPFTNRGREMIAAKLLRKQASNADAVAERLATARGATPGFNPTVGQAANDDGIAALERTVRATYPQGFNDVEKAQRGALADALRNIAKTPEAKDAAFEARNASVRPLYDTAKKAVVEGDDVIGALLQRPSMNAAMSQAEKLAAERGQSFGIKAAQEGADGAGAIPAQLQGSALHDLKLGLDDAIGNPGLGGMQGAQRDAALQTKEAFMTWLENKIPAYAQAKSAYANMSRPLNQMDIGEEFYKRFVPALAENGDVPFKTTAQSYAQALREGDRLAQRVTGMKGLKLADIMEPEQMQILQGVGKDAATRAAFEGAGRGAGSDTVQKLAMSNVAAQAGIPNWMASVARVPGGWAKRAGDVLYGDADEQVRLQLARLLQDPKAASEAMKKAGIPPSKYAETLRAMSQATATGTVNAGAQPTQGD